MMKKLDYAIAICGFGLFFVAIFFESGYMKWIMAIIGIQLAGVAVYDALIKHGILSSKKRKGPHITGLSLLNDEDQTIATWDLYEKTSLIIGIDQGENQVDVNLAESVYASTLDVEHAVLNYAGGQWYVEDLDSENGVSVMKSDGQRYQLLAMSPCLLEKGDILFVSYVRLRLT